MIEIMGSAVTYFANPTQGRVAHVNQWELPFAAKNLIHDLVMLPSPSAVHPLMPESMKALLTNSVASLLENCPELQEALYKIHGNGEFANKPTSFVVCYNFLTNLLQRS